MAKKANFNQKKIERHFGLLKKNARIFRPIRPNDSQESSSTISKIQEK
jgi:hypothetical protein